MARIAALEAGLISADNAGRWSAAAELSEFVVEYPDLLWPLVVRQGSSEHEDLRMAIATCVLEHILEHHFDEYFPKLESAIRSGNAALKRTLARCWKFGDSEVPSNSER